MKNKTVWFLGAISALVLIFGIYTKTKKCMSISIIGGADGPTSVFLAGKTGNGFSGLIIGAGLCGLCLAAVLIVRRMKKGGRQ